MQKTMEKAILKTIIYADIFDYPLKVWEIHKWLIQKHASLKQVEKALGRLSQKSRPRFDGQAKVKSKKDYYFLPRREKIAAARLKKEKQSKKYLRWAKLISLVFKIIPWIRLVGVSGSVAVDNAKATEDIDLFVITSKNRIFLSRFFLLLILEILGRRRKKGDSGEKSAGKICINLLLEEDNLEQINKDIYLAHEVLQMKVLWQRHGVYQKYLEENSWAFKYLPNWKSSMEFSQNLKLKAQSYSLSFGIFEKIAKFFQLKYMGEPKGNEKILNGALYFHPRDLRGQILKEYNKRIAKYSIH